MDPGDFFSGLAYRPHLSGDKGHRKRIFSKTLSRVEIFKNAGFWSTYGRTKPAVFEYDDVVNHLLLTLSSIKESIRRRSIVRSTKRASLKTVVSSFPSPACVGQAPAAW